MRKIYCDICERHIQSSEREILSDNTETLLTLYANMESADLCFNCLDDLSKILKEAFIQWKLIKGRNK